MLTFDDDFPDVTFQKGGSVEASRPIIVCEGFVPDVAESGRTLTEHIKGEKTHCDVENTD